MTAALELATVPDRPTIVVCASSERVRAAAREGLSTEDVDVHEVHSVDELLPRCRQHDVDVVILRVEPAHDPASTMKRLRRATRAEIVVLSPPSAHDTAIDLLDLGANDYLCRDLDDDDPVALREFRARVARALRTRDSHADPRELALGDVRIHLDRHRVMRAGTPVVLTDTERRLLRVLVSHLDEVVDHDTLLGEAWPEDQPGNHATLRTYVSRLRKKLGWTDRDRLGPHIRGVRGVGYGLFIHGLDRARTVSDGDS